MADSHSFPVEAGMGKSVALRLLYERLSALREITMAELSRPQSGLTDFYRELGLKQANVSSRER